MGIVAKMADKVRERSRRTATNKIMIIDVMTGSDFCSVTNNPF